MIYKFKRAALNIAGFIGIFVAINVWQTRNARSGIAPTFTLENTSGRVEVLPKSATTVKILYFFAPWCGVCKASMGNLSTLRHWMPDLEIAIVGLDYESPEEIRVFTAGHHLEIPTFLGSSVMRDAWGIEAYPTYVVLDKNNTIRCTSVGYSSTIGLALRAFWVSITG